MSQKLRAFAVKEHPKEKAAVKEVDAKELERVIVQDMQYSDDFLHQNKTTRLRTFAAFLLNAMRLDRWTALRDLDPLVRAAALHTLSFPPPGGALEYFEVRIFVAKHR
jgi:hypothetical protein